MVQLFKIQDQIGKIPWLDLSKTIFLFQDFHVFTLGTLVCRPDTGQYTPPPSSHPSHLPIESYSRLTNDCPDVFIAP